MTAANNQRNAGPLGESDEIMVTLRRVALHIRNCYDLLANDTESTVVVEDILNTARLDIGRIEDLFEKRRQPSDE